MEKSPASITPGDFNRVAEAADQIREADRGRNLVWGVGEGQVLIAAFTQMGVEWGHGFDVVEQRGEFMIGDGLKTGGKDFMFEGAGIVSDSRLEWR